MSFKILLILLLAFGSPSSLYAKSIALGDSRNSKDFSKYLQNKPHLKSFRDLIMEKERQRDSRFIQQKYQLALKGMSMPDLSPSIFLLKEIASSSQKGLILNKEALETVQKSHYRLANLERKKSKLWIQVAVLKDPNFKPSPIVFNPLIIAEHQKTLAKSLPHFLNVEARDISSPQDVLFINGQALSSSFLLHPQQDYFIKVYRHGFFPQLMRLSGEELLNAEGFELQKINFGSCKNPVFTEYKNEKPDLIFYSKSCVVSYKKQEAFLAQSYQGLAVQPLSITQETNFDSLSPLNKWKGSPKKTPSKIPFYKRKAFWLALGTSTLLSSVLIMSQRNKQTPRTIITPVYYD